MEKNLPFLSVSFLDDAYNKFILPFLGKLDEGNIFKNIITSLLYLLSIGVLLGGVYFCLEGIFGESGYIEQYLTNERFSTGKKAGAGVGLLIGFILSLATAWVLCSIIKKRTDQMNDVVYDGLIKYIFKDFFPRMIILYGELVFALIIYISLSQIFATLVGSFVYTPLFSYPSMMIGIVPGMEIMASNIPYSVAGDYEYFVESLKGGLIGIVSSFVILIIFYLYREVYNYMLSLVINLLAFIPRFAIPISIRKNE